LYLCHSERALAREGICSLAVFNKPFEYRPFCTAQSSNNMPDAIEQDIRVQGDSSATIPGQLRLHSLKSKVFNNKRMLRVWLPPEYDHRKNRGRRYPVFYLNDGQNLFDRSTAFGGVEWQVDETADRLVREERIEPLIIVGIDNAQENRIREYVPYRSSDIPVRTVTGKKYPEFLLQEVMPCIAKRYRTAFGPEHTGLGGSSLGALISLYAAMMRPRVFGRLLVESPSLFIADRRLVRDSARVKRWPERIFLGVGTKELGDDVARNQRVVDDVRALEQILRKAGLSGDRLEVDIDEGATHSESAWARRLPEALAFLFGK
jgi:predicted alpha/beta superfamily hydrolase